MVKILGGPKYKRGDKVRQQETGWNIPPGDIVTIVNVRHSKTRWCYEILEWEKYKNVYDFVNPTFGFVINGTVTNKVDKEYEELLI